MNTVKLQITLPTEDYNAFIHSGYGISINDYILEIIKQKINNTNSLTDMLIEGYKTSCIEDEKISADYSFTDFEHWD